MKRLLMAMGFIVAAGPARALTIAVWTFETNPPANLNNSATISGISADSGLGTASGQHASAHTDWSTPVGNGSAESLSSNDWSIGDFYQFQVSTLGLESVQLSFEQTRSGTGPSSFKLQWSTNGTTFTDFSSYIVADVGGWSSGSFTSGSSQSFNLSTVTALNNQSNIYLRLTNTASVSTSAGTNRIDDVTIQASNIQAVPEPVTMSLGLAGAGLYVRRRVQKSKR